MTKASIYGMRATSILPSLLIALAIVAGGCDYLEKNRIARILKNREEALLKGNVGGYLSFFASDYNGGWLAYDVAKVKVNERLKRKPLPAAAFGKREVEINGDRAVITEKFIFEDKVEGRSRRYEETQHLLLVRGSQGWLCAGGSKILELMGGRVQEEHEIERTMLRREAALVEEDIRAFMDLISPDYKHKNEGPDKVKQKVLQVFRVYDDIEFRSFDRKIYFFGNAATVQQKFSMTAVLMGEPKTFSGEERFELIKTEEGWKFIKGFK